MNATYTVTLPDGTVVTRKSKHAFTHVVAVINQRTGKWDVQRWTSDHAVADAVALQASAFTDVQVIAIEGN